MHLYCRPRNRTYIMTTIIQAPYMMIRERKKGEPEPEGNDRYEGYCKDFADMISREKGISFEIRSVVFSEHIFDNSKVIQGITKETFPGFVKI